jgi:hypothetical protein
MIEALYENYRRVMLYQGLRGDFNFDADQSAYVAFVEGKTDELKALIELRGGSSDFKLPTDDPKWLEKAVEAYANADRIYDFSYPDEIVSVEKIEKGKQKGEYVEAVYA